MNEELNKQILSTGTTILGIVCKDGVVMAGDRRGSVGRLIYEKNAQKVVVLNDYLLLSGCGSATEVQKVGNVLRAQLRLKELKSKSRPTVRQAASLLSNIEVTASAFILAGFDEDSTFSLYDILGGHLQKVEDYTASIGSGMPYALGLLERQFKKEMSLKEGVELAKEALLSSTQRDSASGNGIDIFTISKDGIKQVVAQTLKPSLKQD